MSSPRNANCDGLRSAPDVSALLIALRTLDARQCGADANQDGVVDTADIPTAFALVFRTAGPGVGGS